MLKSNKGFTLIELLATIVLLGIILTIAVTSFSSVHDTVKKRQKENLISKVKIAAKRYVTDRDIQKVYVETLIEEGYIEADNESNQIIAPDTKESLNCYYVDYTSGEAEVKAGTEMEDGTCDYDIISDAILSIKYCVVTEGAICLEGNYKNIRNDWIEAKGKDVYLKVVNVPDFLASETFKWISPLAPDVRHEGIDYKIELTERNYVNDVFQAILYKGNKSYTVDARIKIDNKEPIVQDLTVAKPDKWAQKKKISATIVDNESGLSAYKVTQESSAPTSGWITSGVSGNSQKIEFNATSNGTYYIWVKDVAGNINQSTISNSIVNVSKIDSIAPSCTHSGDNTKWTKKDVIISWGCDDGTGDSSSGCSTSTLGGSKTFSSTKKTAQIESYTIKDNVGNETICPKRTADIYIDKKKPEISSLKITSSEDDYNSKYTQVKVVGTDNHSGVSKVCVTRKSSYDDCSWKNFDGNYTGDYTFNVDDGNGETYTLNAYIKDSVGNISEVKSKKYTLYEMCTDEEAYRYGDWGSCSKSCGGGYKYRDVYYRDEHFQEYCRKEENGDRSNKKCNTQSCYVYINAYRYDDNCNQYYITMCDDTECTYTEKNGASKSGTIKKSNLKEKAPSKCTDDIVDASSCGARIMNVNDNNRNIVEFKITGGCKIASVSGDKCSTEKYVDDSGVYWISANYNGQTSCTITVNLSGGTYEWLGASYKKFHWTTKRCSSSSVRGDKYYCSGACDGSISACAK